MKRIFVRWFCGGFLTVLCLAGAALADGQDNCAPVRHRKVRVHAKAVTISEEEQLARDYRARRRAGDNRNCPCEDNSMSYCSCGHSYGNRGYAWGYNSDPYATGAGWSRGFWRGSDLPTSEYSPNVPR